MTPKSGRLAAKTAFPPNYFHGCKSVLQGPRAIFPFIYKGFVAVGRGFSGPAFCTSGLNTRFQRHVMMRINAFIYHLSFLATFYVVDIHHSPSRPHGSPNSRNSRTQSNHCTRPFSGRSHPTNSECFRVIPSNSDPSRIPGSVCPTTTPAQIASIRGKSSQVILHEALTHKNWFFQSCPVVPNRG
jgi:hypothetical protein